jgi:hypothetical protein
MTHRDDSTVDLDRVMALAAAAGLTIEEFLQTAPAAPPGREEQRRPGSSLYQRIGHAGGLQWLLQGTLQELGFRGRMSRRSSPGCGRGGPRS